MEKAERKRWFRLLDQRLDQGAIEYGDKSFNKPVASLLDEIQQELLDVVNWSAILWTKIERLRKAAGSHSDQSTPRSESG